MRLSEVCLKQGKNLPYRLGFTFGQQKAEIGLTFAYSSVTPPNGDIWPPEKSNNKLIRVK